MKNRDNVYLNMNVGGGVNVNVGKDKDKEKISYAAVVGRCKRDLLEFMEGGDKSVILLCGSFDIKR